MDDNKNTLSRLKWVMENLENDKKEKAEERRSMSNKLQAKSDEKKAKPERANRNDSESIQSNHTTKGIIKDNSLSLSEINFRIDKLLKKVHQARPTEALRYKSELTRLKHMRRLYYDRNERVLKAIESTAISSNRSIDQVQDVYADWNNVEFMDDYVKVFIHEKKDTFSFTCIGSRPIYNWIKDGFATRLEPLTVRLHSTRSPELTSKPLLNSVVKALSIKEAFRMDPTQIRVVKSFLDSCHDNVSMLFLPNEKDRSSYMSFLCNRQSDSHKFIPVWEFGYAGKEEAFLFTLKSLSGYAVILENCSIDRATYICKCSEAKLNYTTQRIFDYFSSEMKKKRLLARRGDANELFGLNLHAIDHDNYSYWKSEIQRYLR